MKMTWKMMFPLNPIPPSFLALIVNFKTAKKGARIGSQSTSCLSRISFCFCGVAAPFIGLDRIANSGGDVSKFYHDVKVSDSIVIDRL
jgi:hypothetical protein